MVNYKNLSYCKQFFCITIRNYADCGKGYMKRETKQRKIIDWLKLVNDEELHTVYLFVTTIIKLKKILSRQQ